MTPGDFRTGASSLQFPLMALHYFVYMIPPQNVMPARVTPVWVHPGCCTEVRISLQYKISQRYHVNTKRPHVLVWNRSAGRLEREAHAQCLRFWIMHVFYQHEVHLQIARYMYEMTKSSFKRNMKSKSHPVGNSCRCKFSLVNTPKLIENQPRVKPFQTEFHFDLQYNIYTKAIYSFIYLWQLQKGLFH